MHFYLFALSIRTSEQIVYLFSGKPSMLVHGRFLHFLILCQTTINAGLSNCQTTVIKHLRPEKAYRF